MTLEMTSSATSAGRKPTLPWLRNIRVSAIGTSPTLDVASRVLRQLGAQVRTGLEAADLDDAEVVLVDRIGGAAEPAATYLDSVAKRNKAVWVTASAYGLETSRADARASDLSLMAAGGILGHSRIGDEWAPTLPPRALGQKLVGYVVAVSAMHALHSWRADGKPVHVDVPAQGAVIATGLALEMAHALARCPDQGGSARYGAPSGFFTCQDGAVYVLALEEHQWRAFRDALTPALESVITLEDARANADFVNERLAEWTADRTMEECERILQGAGVPCTAVNTVASFVERSHSIGRSIELQGPAAQALPAEITEIPADHVDEQRATSPLSLADLRVLDAGHVLAVPLAAAWLGAMGAQVSKLEDPQRLDIYRRRGPFAVGEPGLDRSAYFNQLNFCKTSLDVNVGQPDADLDVRKFDVVMHNLTPKRAKAVGVDTETVLGTGSPILAFSSSGFGGRGDWSGYRAYGHNIHAFAGLVSGTRDARGEMGDMGTPWADPLTSAAVAAWVLAWSLSPERTNGVGIDISMAELTAAQLTELIDADPSSSYDSDEVSREFFLRVPGTAQLLAVSLHDSNDRARFETVIGRPLPDITTRGELVDLGALDQQNLTELLLAEGIAVSPVFTSHDLARDEFVRSTGLFRPVRSSALGVYEVTGLPWKFVGRPRTELQAAPERRVD
ncbi:CoA transferase [Rhodococcus koreensis]